MKYIAGVYRYRSKVGWKYHVCVCVYILRPAEHVLKACVLETLVEYKMLGGKPLDIYLV
jgi:hypothetical protein